MGEWLLRQYRIRATVMKSQSKSRLESVLALGVVGLVGCATPGASQAKHQKDAPVLSVSVRHLEGEDAWEVHYRLPAPTQAVAFQRGRYEFRVSNWTVTSPSHVELKRVEQQDFLRSLTGVPFREVTLKVKTYFRSPEKNYQVFLPFTDGGVLFYTGQFNLTPVKCREGGPCELATVEDVDYGFEARYLLHPRPSEQIALLGEIFPGRTEWTSTGDGTYVYFGKTKPVQSEHLVAVVDSGLPTWLRVQTEDLLPKLFAFYSNRLGSKLNFKPVVFISYGEEENPKSKSFNGGTLPGLVQLEIRLPRGLGPEEDPSVPVDVSHLLAHETVHLWNGQMFNHRVKGGDWLHEGSADALAWRALRELHIIDDDRFWREQSQGASRCLLGLEGQPLKDSSRSGKFMNHYSCGATINLLAEAVLRSAHSNEDLFRFWGRVFAANGNGTYDEGALFKVLEGIPGSSATVALVKQLVDGPADSVEATLSSELERLRLKTVVVKSPDDAEYQMLAGFRAARSVVALDCGPGARMEGRGFYKVAEDAKCKTLTRDQMIAQIGSFNTRKDGVLAYDYIVSTCARPARLKVGDERKVVEIACAESPLMKRPAYFKISGYAATEER